MIADMSATDRDSSHQLVTYAILPGKNSVRHHFASHFSCRHDELKILSPHFDQEHSVEKTINSIQFSIVFFIF